MAPGDPCRTAAPPRQHPVVLVQFGSVSHFSFGADSKLAARTVIYDDGILRRLRICIVIEFALDTGHQSIGLMRDACVRSCTEYVEVQKVRR